MLNACCGGGCTYLTSSNQYCLQLKTCSTILKLLNAEFLSHTYLSHVAYFTYVPVTWHLLCHTSHMTCVTPVTWPVSHQSHDISCVTPVTWPVSHQSHDISFVTPVTWPVSHQSHDLCHVSHLSTVTFQLLNNHSRRRTSSLKDSARSFLPTYLQMVRKSWLSMLMGQQIWAALTLWWLHQQELLGKYIIFLGSSK